MKRSMLPDQRGQIREFQLYQVQYRNDCVSRRFAHGPAVATGRRSARCCPVCKPSNGQKSAT